MILLSHPIGNEFVREALVAFDRADMLERILDYDQLEFEVADQPSFSTIRSRTVRPAFLS